jgi:CheY-like chemotaxis protein
VESLGGTCGVKEREDGASGSCFWISIPFKPDEDDVKTTQKLSKYSIHDRASCQNSQSSANVFLPGFINQGTSDMELLQEEQEEEECSVAVHEERSPLRILLVDDSILIRKATSRSLVKEGHHVEMAQHGAECLKILESRRGLDGSCNYAFDLIMMDLQMPVMDGMETTRRIREMERMSNIMSLPNDLEEAAQSGGQRPHIMIIGISANTAVEAEADCIESGMDGFIEKPLKMKKFNDYFAKASWLAKR